MKTTILSTTTGQQIPVTFQDDSIKPLMHLGKPVTDGNGNVVMNNRWIYVDGCAINVWRARMFEKRYLSEVSIQESIGINKLMDKDLKTFVDQVSDKLVFKKYGKTYRVFLEKKTNRTFGIKKVALFNWTIDPNTKHDGIHNYNLSIDWKSKFYVK